MLGRSLILHTCVAWTFGLKESDVFLAGQALSGNESESSAIITKWLDDIMWTEIWDSPQHRNLAYTQIMQLADLSKEGLPSLSFSVGQALYSYFWFEDNGPEVNMQAALKAVDLYGISLNHSGCNDLTMGVGSFITDGCQDRWLHLIMLSAEVGAELAAKRSDVRQASQLLERADALFQELNQFPFFSHRQWTSLYDINTNSHVFPSGLQQRPVWPKASIPLALWLEEMYPVFLEDLDSIIKNNAFDALYFKGHVSMTQFSGRRESWAPLNLIHNGVLSPHACEVANRTCELLAGRPEIANCTAKDVGAAFARLQPGMGIKPHLWTAPPRLGVHLGLRSQIGASMLVGNQQVEWKDGEAIVFDDTYIHSVKHRGKEDRYLLIAWFCHPCDPVHASVPGPDPTGLCAQR
mmetsp:Transcript_54181/g.100095  ORF Transcript_54181/g.100095 Transcript_54181/m.100095 type:complete len:408 (-) Transcript_54181:28-1251(-)